jgi:hypothetical protein
MGLIVDGNPPQLTNQGIEVVNSIDNPFDEPAKSMWRNILLQMEHQGKDTPVSHPYQVLLRLVAKRPGITRAKCALALEAMDDSQEELNRIVALSDNTEEEIIAEIATTKTNWDNGKKVLPHFAEQLGDVVKTGNCFYLANDPGSGETDQESSDEVQAPSPRATRRPRSASEVTANTIARAGTIETFDEEEPSEPCEVAPEALERRLARLRDRLRRHNLIVQQIAQELETEGGTLFENPFDCLAVFDNHALLIEVKSLDGTEADEVSRVREALSQLLYYESFVTEPYVENDKIVKIACFESKIQDRHIDWLLGIGIITMWVDGEGFTADDNAKAILEEHFGLAQP